MKFTHFSGGFSAVALRNRGFNAALSACASRQQWTQVLGLAEQLQATFEPDAIALNAVATALERRGRWLPAAALLQRAQALSERLLAPEAAVLGAALRRPGRRSASLLGRVEAETPKNLREVLEMRRTGGCTLKHSQEWT